MEAKSFSWALAGAAPVIALLVSGCDYKPQPGAADVTWKVERTADKKAYHLSVSATYVRKGLEGFYLPEVTLTDDRGCQTSFKITGVQIADTSITSDTVKLESTVKLAHPAAKADMQIEYGNAAPDEPTGLTHFTVFDDSRVLDATLHPPAIPIKPCTTAATRPKRLEDLSREEQIAIGIISAGFPCHRVTDLYLDSAGQIIAHCVKYPSGRGRAEYKIDADAGQVELVE